MDFTIDYNQLSFLLEMNSFDLFWYLFKSGGWLIFVIVFGQILFFNRLSSKQKRYIKSVRWSLLAIDIPKDNEQSMVAVEQIFANLSGIKSKPNLIEKYRDGKMQLYISLEIVSLEGYIQFLIRTPEQFRDLVEAAVYAQYPEAEITEVEDYTSLIPSDVHLETSDYNLWGTEFSLNKHSGYPIKTYRSFEHSLSQTFSDPMSAMLEIMSKLGKGEQLALQIIISPSGDDWKEGALKIVKKIIGEKMETKKHLGDKFVDLSLNSLDKISEAVITIWADVGETTNKKDEPHNLMQYLTPGDKTIVESIQIKLSQLSFSTRFRLYYLAHNDKFLRGRGVNAILGAINQFGTSNLNSFSKYKTATTDVDYFFVKRRISKRQKTIIKLFKDRSFYLGASSSKSPKFFYLSTEELATLYHFPTIAVKAPLLKRAELKKSEPPTTLPIELVDEKQWFAPMQSGDGEKTEKSPEDEFVIDESLVNYDFDNNFYEERFSKKINPGKPLSQTEELAENHEPEPPANLPIAK